MSLYNMLFGINDDAPILLGMINTNMDYFDRFRDVELINSGNIIRVFTRLGGNNRHSYKDTWNKIKRNEYYLKDYDDNFDNTYAYIEFSIPDKYKDTAKNMFKNEPMSFEDKFKKELKDMNNPNSEASKKAEKIAEKLINGINNNHNIIEI